MKSRIFYSDTYKELERKVMILLNAHDAFLSARTLRSTRAAGDAMNEVILWIRNYSIIVVEAKSKRRLRIFQRGSYSSFREMRQSADRWLDKRGYYRVA